MGTLGERIKQLRSDLTQEELANILKVDRTTLASWEVNRREPDIATLCRIAAFFNVSVDWLVGHKPAAHPESSHASLITETATDYTAKKEDAWRKVITTAQQYGFEPEIVHQLLIIHAKIAALLKKER